MQKLSVLGLSLLFLYGCSSQNDIPYDKFASGSTKAQIIANLGKPLSVVTVDGKEQFAYITSKGNDFSACFDRYGLLYGFISGSDCFSYQ